MPPGGLLLHTAASTSSPRCCGGGPSTACDLTAGTSLVSVSAYLARLSSCWDIARRDKCRFDLMGRGDEAAVRPSCHGRRLSREPISRGNGHCSVGSAIWWTTSNRKPQRQRSKFLSDFTRDFSPARVYARQGERDKTR